MRKLLITSMLLCPLVAFADPEPRSCPDISQLSYGVFYSIDMDEAGYYINGYFDYNHDMYRRWGLSVRGVQSASFPQALRDANEALTRQKISKLTENASCSGGSRGGMCICFYQVEIPNETTPHFYTMTADTMT